MGIINSIFGSILNVIFEGVLMITPVAALAIAIIIFTLVMRIILTPLQLSSQRGTRKISKIQPEMTRIQEKYKGRTDQASQLKQSQEMQELYKKYKINPFAGCLPLLIQFPLIMALFNVLRAPAHYIKHLGAEYASVASIIIDKVANYQTLLEPYRSQIEAMTRMTKTGYNFADSTQLGQFLSHLTTAQWSQFISQIQDPATTQALSSALELKNNIETFFGLSVVDTPSGIISTQWWVILIPIIAGASTYIFTKITMASNGTDTSNQTGSAASMMKTMNIIMPIMTGTFAYTMPIGLAIYWIAGNVIMLFQQIIINKILDKQDAKFEEQLAKEREEARKNHKTTTKKVMKKVPVQQQNEADGKPKTYTKKVIKKVPIPQNTEE